MVRNFTLNNVDRNKCLLTGFSINDRDGESASTMNLRFVNRDSGDNPELEDEIVYTVGGVKKFAGRIVKMKVDTKIYPYEYSFECVDYTRDLDRRLVVEEYENKTDREIIIEIIETYCTGITYTNVVEGVSIDSIIFNYASVSEAFSNIAKYTGREWYIDYDKDVHYGLKTAESAPFNVEEL